MRFVSVLIILMVLIACSVGADDAATSSRDENTACETADSDNLSYVSVGSSDSEAEKLTEKEIAEISDFLTTIYTERREIYCRVGQLEQLTILSLETGEHPFIVYQNAKTQEYYLWTESSYLEWIYLVGMKRGSLGYLCLDESSIYRKGDEEMANEQLTMVGTGNYLIEKSVSDVDYTFPEKEYMLKRLYSLIMEEMFFGEWELPLGDDETYAHEVYVKTADFSCYNYEYIPMNTAVNHEYWRSGEVYWQTNSDGVLEPRFLAAEIENYSEDKEKLTRNSRGLRFSGTVEIEMPGEGQFRQYSSEAERVENICEQIMRFMAELKLQRTGVQGDVVGTAYIITPPEKEHYSRVEVWCCLEGGDPVKAVVEFQRGDQWDYTAAIERDALYTDEIAENAILIIRSNLHVEMVEGVEAF